MTFALRLTKVTQIQTQTEHDTCISYLSVMCFPDAPNKYYTAPPLLSIVKEICKLLGCRDISFKLEFWKLS